MIRLGIAEELAPLTRDHGRRPQDSLAFVNPKYRRDARSQHLQENAGEMTVSDQGEVVVFRNGRAEYIRPDPSQVTEAPPVSISSQHVDDPPQIPDPMLQDR